MHTFYLMNAEGDLITPGCRWTRHWDDARAFHEPTVARQIAEALNLLCVRVEHYTDSVQGVVTLYGIGTSPAGPTFGVRERDGAFHLCASSCWLPADDMNRAFEGLRMVLDLLNA